jgi:uncharacterized membrane protein YeaQ/YmgE (transglycosylase-associated protein family)
MTLSSFLMPGFLMYVIAVTFDPFVLIVYLLFGFFARRLVAAVAGAVVWDLVIQGLYLLNPGSSYFRLVPSLVGAVVTSAAVFGVRRLSVVVWRRLSTAAPS